MEKEQIDYLMEKDNNRILEFCAYCGDPIEEDQLPETYTIGDVLYCKSCIRRMKYRKRKGNGLRMLVALVVLSLHSVCYADIDVSKLADAIYMAEGGSRASHLYGIMQTYKSTSSRQACINTINHMVRDYRGEDTPKAFIEALQKRYAPIGANNDPKNLNKNWSKNVLYFYTKGK